jgi:hypothetical protein
MVFAETCEEKFDINVKFIAPRTPQHNGVVERTFATLFRKTRATMIEANFLKVSNKIYEQNVLLQQWTLLTSLCLTRFHFIKLSIGVFPNYQDTSSF